LVQPAGRTAGLPLLDELRGRFPRVAVVHDWLTIPGGSEQVVLELLEMFPQAELFTSVYDPSPWPAQITERRVHSSWLGRIPGAVRHYPKLLPLMNRAFRSFDLSSFDLVLSSSHACAKNVRTPPQVLHVCYCHTPMRYAWEEGFLRGEEVGAPTRLLLPALLGRLRRQDLAGASVVAARELRGLVDVALRADFRSDDRRDPLPVMNPGARVGLVGLMTLEA